MANSRTERMTFLCSNCGVEFETETWLIVDAEEHPDLLERLRQGTLFVFTCTNCGVEGLASTPFLLYRPGTLLPLIFSPASDRTPEENEADISRLFELLRNSLGDGWEEEWASQKVAVSIRRLIRTLNDESGSEFRAIARELYFQHPHWQSLRETYVTFVQADTWSESHLILEQNPQLLSEEAELIAEQFVRYFSKVAMSPQDEYVLDEFISHQGLLKRCREVGVPQAISEKMQDSGDEKPEFTRRDGPTHTSRDDADLTQGVGLSIPSDFQTDMRRIFELKHRYEITGDSELFSEAIRCWQSIIENPGLEAAPPEFRSAVLGQTGNDFVSRFLSLRCLEDLKQGLDLLNQSVQAALPGSHYHVTSLHNLGYAYQVYYEHTRDTSALEQAIRVRQSLVELVPPGSIDLTQYLDELAFSLHDRYRHAGNLSDLERATGLWEQALRIGSRNSRQQAALLTNLGIALSDHYEFSGNVISLEEAIKLQGKAWSVLEDVPETLPALVTAKLNLSASLIRHYEISSEISELQAAINICEDIERSAQHNQLPISGVILNHGTALKARYDHLGHLGDLERAIKYFQDIAENKDLVPSSDLTHAWESLGNCFRARYAHFGALTDLDGAISAYQQAMDLIPTGSPGRPSSLNNLGTGLRDRYRLIHNLADLDRSIELHEQALQTSSLKSIHRPLFLNNLGASLSDRYERKRNIADLKRAIDAFEEAVLVSSAETLDRSMYLSNLASAKREFYQRSQDMLCLEQAIQYNQEAVETSKPNSPRLAMFLNSLGLSLAEYSKLSSDEQHIDKARQVWERACEHGLRSNYAATLDASRAWSESALTRHSWEEAGQSCLYGVLALDLLVGSQIFRAGKASWLRDAQELPARTAYALARCQELTDAVVTLEHGRARLLMEALELARVDLERLTSLGYDDLYRRYRAKVEEAANIGNVEVSQKDLSAKTNDLKDPNTVRDELENAIREIQQIPGFEDFFRTPDFAEIQRSLTVPRGDADVPNVGIYLLVTEVGGLALIVHSNGINVVWLDFSEADLFDLLVRYEDDNVIGGYLFAQIGVSFFDKALNEVLPILGEKVVGPVAATLKSLQAQTVTLIPTGRLSLLPIHAAPYQIDGEARTLLDEFNIAYTPSAQALIHSHNTLSSLHKAESTLFAIGNPLPLPKAVAPLAFAKHEVEEIASLFGADSTALCETKATRSNVERALGETTYLHLSCHGLFNVNDPLASGFILSNGEILTLKDLIARPRLIGTRLAVLSACQTAMVDFMELPEEAIGLPAGFLQTGVPGVIGTLWSVNDLSTMLLMVRFYEFHLQGDPATGEGPLPPARALRRAQLWLRDATNAELGERFKVYKRTAPDAPDSSRMAYALAREMFIEHTLRDPNERPFAHPYYWAAFVFYGV